MGKSDNYGVIEHDGIVEKSDNGSVTVKIVSSSACAGCHAEGYCSLSGSEEKIVMIPGIYNVAAGDDVTILMKKSMGYNAVLLGYVFPFILIVVVLILLVALSVRESLAGLSAIAVLIPYYLMLWFFRKRIDNKFTFTIKA